MTKSSDLMSVKSVATKLDNLIKDVTVKAGRLEREYKTCPAGRLYVRGDLNKPSFYVWNSNEHNHNKGERSVKKSDPIIDQLTRKHVVELELNALEGILEMLQNSMESIEEMSLQIKGVRNGKTLHWVIDKLYDKKFALDNEEYGFYNRRHSNNRCKPETLKYTTDSGIKVRSKSERSIANRLDAYNILYNYEPQLRINGSVVHPDFYIKKSNGETLIWEHFGMMSDAEYLNNVRYKIEQYYCAGYKQHTNLICTYEKDIESEQTINRIIESRLL